VPVAVGCRPDSRRRFGMEKRRLGWLRPVLVIGVLGALTAALLTSPANAHLTTFSHLKQHIKKIAKKVAKKQATTIVESTVGPTLFIEETELQRFGPVTANVGDAEANVATFGPFTISLLCEDSAGNVRVRVQIATSQDDSIVQSDGVDEDDFDTTDTDVDLADDTNGASGGPQDAFDEDDQFWVAGPAGTPAFNGSVGSAANFGGSDCWVQGYVIETIPA
jgi:hypothetical protein